MSAPEYEWILCEAPSLTDPFAPLKKIGVLAGAKERQFELVRNRAGSAQFTLRTNDQMAYKILDNVNLGDVRGTVRKCIRIRRNNGDLWSGPIWGIDGSLDAGTITFQCVGWLETLQKKILHSTLDYSNGGSGEPSDVIAYGLLNAVNAQDTARPILVQPGTVTGTLQNRNRYYVMGQALGPALQELSDIEAGYDYEVDPVTRALNLYAWDSFTDRTNIRLGYNWGPDNIQKFSWKEAADRMCNVMTAISLGAPVRTDFAESEDVYGRFEEWNTLTGANQLLLLPYIQAEFAVRGVPLLTFSLTPYPRTDEGGFPSLFDDYQIGDKVYLNARKDAFVLENQAVRVFGASVSLDENGNETITSIQTAPASG